MKIRPRLFQRWIALSKREITVQRIRIRETNCAIHWVAIYPMDGVIHLLNYWGQFVEMVSGFWVFKGVPSLLLQLLNLGTWATTPGNWSKT